MSTETEVTQTALQAVPVGQPNGSLLQRATFTGPLSGNPEEVVEKATAIATKLKAIVERQGLAVQIGRADHKYVKAEGWTTMCAMLGIFPRTDWTRPIGANLGTAWEARVTFVHIASGRDICSGEAMCSPDEKRWEDADQFAIRSMAETRATAKAARIGFSWIMVLAGYSATPAEEVSAIEKETTKREAAPHGSGPTPSEEGWVEVDAEIRKKYQRTKSRELPSGMRWKKYGERADPKTGDMVPDFRLEMRLPAGITKGFQPKADATAAPAATTEAGAFDVDEEIRSHLRRLSWGPAKAQVKAHEYGAADGDFVRIPADRKGAFLDYLASQ